MIGHLAVAGGCSRVVAEAANDIHLIRAEPPFDHKWASRTTLARKAVAHDDPHRIARHLKTELFAVTSRNSSSHWHSSGRRSGRQLDVQASLVNASAGEGHLSRRRAALQIGHHRRVEPKSGLSRAELDAVIADHVGRIAQAVPEGSISVSGSTLLGHYGGHDVDLVVLAPQVLDAAGRLRLLYPPLYEDEWRADWAAFRDPGPPQVDVVLTHPGTQGDAHHRRAWELLLADAELRAEYERLKAAGMSGAQKAVFFDRVVAMLGEAGS